MPDQIEYRDENGNLVDPAEIDDYEEVDPEAAPKSKRGRVIAASIAAVALLAGGAAGTYHFMGERGDAPAPAVASAPQSAPQSVSSASVIPSSTPSSVSSSASPSVSAAPLPPLNACAGGVNEAKWPAGAPQPEAELRVLNATQLPSTITGLITSQVSQQLHKMQVLQTAPTQLGVYWDQRDSGLDGGWWKATIDTTGQYPAVAGEGQGTGHDVDFPGACKTVFDPGTYRVVGEGIPLGARDGAKGQITVAALKVDASATTPGAPQMVWLVVRDKLLKTELVRSGGTTSDGVSSSAASTTPSDGGA